MPDGASGRYGGRLAVLIARGPWMSEQGSALADDICRTIPSL